MTSPKSKSLIPPQNKKSGRGKSKLRRSNPTQMVLEQRYVFDGAGAADAVHAFDGTVESVTPPAVARTSMTDGGSVPPWELPHRGNGVRTMLYDGRSENETATKDDPIYRGTAPLTVTSPSVNEVQDESRGNIFKPDGSIDLTAPKDDHRVVTTTKLKEAKLKEGSTDTRNIASPPPEAVFFVTEKPNQQVSLSLIGGNAGSTDYAPPIEYSTDGGINWAPYSGGKIPPSDNEGALLVSARIASESAGKPNEAFKLQVTTDGNISYGTATSQKPGLVFL